VTYREGKSDPLARARLRKDGFGLELDCPFCGKIHHHAWGLGGRVPHCSAQETGEREYILVAADDEVAAANTDVMRSEKLIGPLGTYDSYCEVTPDPRCTT
jgi:hypothetical protein